MDSQLAAGSIAFFDKANKPIINSLLTIQEYAIIFLDEHKNILSWNKGAENIYGYYADEVVGTPVSGLFTKQEIENNIPDAYFQSAFDNSACQYEDWKYKKDGSRFYANVVLTCLYNTDKSLQGYVKITRDITYEKQLAEENKLLTAELEKKVEERTNDLSAALKELESFSYSVSHDLRTPLRAVSGYIEMLREDYAHKLDQEGQDLLEVVSSNANMMGQLIDNLLSFSRMSRLAIINSDIDMQKLVQKAVLEVMQMITTPEYNFEIGTLYNCKGDENMLKQVWVNLIDNARKYSSKKENPVIKIGSTKKDNLVTYFVKDNGVGFDMQYADNLFGVFQRMHRQEEFDGTGVGLALVKRIISKHGGQVWAIAHLNQGAGFYFTLPAAGKNENR